jgi:hypothetical protein
VLGLGSAAEVPQALVDDHAPDIAARCRPSSRRRSKPSDIRATERARAFAGRASGRRAPRSAPDTLSASHAQRIRGFRGQPQHLGFGVSCRRPSSTATRQRRPRELEIRRAANDRALEI